jgi:C4-dicarboxylate-specific signal transduction histidine kinase
MHTQSRFLCQPVLCAHCHNSGLACPPFGGQDREGRQIAMDVMAASIAHEINQPLGATVTNANAALRWMANATPDLDETRAALTRIVKDGQRANQIIGGIRSMFKKDIHGRAQLGVKDLVREVATMIEVDLRTHRVSISLELREELPQLVADRGELQEVFLNLCANAIEAMRSVDRARLLRIKSDIIKESSHVLVTIVDSGTGIDGKNRDRIFEPFFTTQESLFLFTKPSGKLACFACPAARR